MRTRTKHLSLSISALLTAGALAACGGSSDNGVAAKSPDGILNAAAQAIDGARSVHISGSVVSNGTPITLDLHLVAGKGATGSMSSDGRSFKLVSIGNEVYIQGSQSFWQSLGGATAAQLLDGKWLKTSATGSFATIGQLTSMRELFNQVLSGHGTLAKGQKTTVDGQQVVAVNDTTRGGTLFVATTGTPYPIEIRKVGGESGQVVFDQYNQSVTLTAPANAIDASKLQGL
jgi:hypothetical protein